MTEPNNSSLNYCQHNPLASNCTYCGAYLHPIFSTSKTLLYTSDPQASTKRHLKSLRTSLRKFQKFNNPFQQSENTFEFLENIVYKFQFSIQTMALGVYLFNKLINKNHLDREEYSEQSEFYSSVCLMIAAKAIQLDKNIPYFSRYQRYSDKTHTKQQYQKAEAELLQQFEFDVQIPTFVTFLSYYLNNGVVFENDELNQEDVYKLQSKVIQTAYDYIKSGEFVCYDQQKLAAKIVFNARKEFKLDWNQIIEQYSMLPLSQFEDALHSDSDQLVECVTPLSETQCSNDSLFTRSTTSKIQLSEKLAQRILKKNECLKVSSPFCLQPFRSLNNFS